MERHIMLFEEFINEATTDGSIESMIETIKLAFKMGIFDEDFFSEIRTNVISGVHGSLEGESLKLPSEKRAEFDRYVDMMMSPIKDSKNAHDLVSNMAKIAIIKNGIVKRLELSESLEEAFSMTASIKWLKDGMHKAKDSAIQWWKENSKDIMTTIVNFLVNFITGLLTTVAQALLGAKSSYSLSNS